MWCKDCCFANTMSRCIGGIVVPSVPCCWRKEKENSATVVGALTCWSARSMAILHCTQCHIWSLTFSCLQNMWHPALGFCNENPLPWIPFFDISECRWGWWLGCIIHINVEQLKVYKLTIQLPIQVKTGHSFRTASRFDHNMASTTPSLTQPPFSLFFLRSSNIKQERGSRMIRIDCDL